MIKKSELNEIFKKAKRVAKSASTGLAFNQQQLLMGYYQIAFTVYLLEEIGKLTKTIKSLDEQNQKLQKTENTLATVAAILAAIALLSGWQEIKSVLVGVPFSLIGKLFIVLGIALFVWAVANALLKSRVKTERG